MDLLFSIVAVENDAGIEVRFPAGNPDPAWEFRDDGTLVACSRGPDTEDQGLSLLTHWYELGMALQVQVLENGVVDRTRRIASISSSRDGQRVETVFSLESH